MTGRCLVGISPDLRYSTSTRLTTSVEAPVRAETTEKRFQVLGADLLRAPESLRCVERIEALNV